jgi:hypothetical protein
MKVCGFHFKRSMILSIFNDKRRIIYYVMLYAKQNKLGNIRFMYLHSSL